MLHACPAGGFSEGGRVLVDQKPVLILGVGNLLLKDEGVGVHVAQRLMAMDLPPDVEVLDGGTAGLDLLEAIEGRDKVVVVDTVKAGKEPGTILCFAAEDLEDTSERRLSLHDMGLSDLMKIADILGVNKPQITIIGIQPKDMGTASLELSPEIEAQIPRVIDLVLKEIGS
jgi:hydrogenase maturation protease